MAEVSLGPGVSLTGSWGSEPGGGSPEVLDITAVGAAGIAVSSSVGTSSRATGLGVHSVRSAVFPSLDSTDSVCECFLMWSW